MNLVREKTETEIEIEKELKELERREVKVAEGTS